MNIKNSVPLRMALILLGRLKMEMFLDTLYCINYKFKIESAIDKVFYRPHCNPVQGQNRARTGPEQGFPCVLILTGKNLFSLQGTPLLIAGILYSLQGMGLQCT